MSKQSRRPNRAARRQPKPPVGAKQSRHGSYRAYWLVAVVAAVALVAAATLVGRGGDANAAGPIKVGAVAPAVSGTDVVTGRAVSSGQLAGKPILYYLSEGVMCQACLVQIQALQQQAAAIRNGGLQLVSVTNDDAATLARAARDYRITTPLIADESRSIVKSFGVLGGIPAGVGMHADTADHTFVLVDSSGKVRFVKDYPSMWVDVKTLLGQLPKVA